MELYVEDDSRSSPRTNDFKKPIHEMANGSNKFAMTCPKQNKEKSELTCAFLHILKIINNLLVLSARDWGTLLRFSRQTISFPK